MNRIFAYAAGIFFMAVGLAGAVLPFLPGWPFFFVGLSLVAPRHAIRLRRRLHRTFFKHDTVHLTEWRPLDVHAGFTTKHFPIVLKKTDELLDLSKQNAFKEILWKSHVALAHEKASSGRFAFLNQVHGDKVVVLEDAKLYEKEGFYHFLEADGILTNIPRLTLLVMTADCLSVFLCAARGAGRSRKADWVGLVHAGWRGTEKRISAKALDLLCERSGCRPSDVLVQFGPSIGRRHYEVGPEFCDRFRGPSLRARRSKWYFDLAGENRRQLLAAGVRESAIVDPRICTISENAHFYSFRKEKDEAGRIISFITKL
jgi:polyphenol oxidase